MLSGEIALKNNHCYYYYYLMLFVCKMLVYFFPLSLTFALLIIEILLLSSFVFGLLIHSLFISNIILYHAQRS